MTLIEAGSTTGYWLLIAATINSYRNKNLTLSIKAKV